MLQIDPRMEAARQGRTATMSEAEREGTTKDAAGPVKDGIGDVTSDLTLQGDGKIDMADGKLQGESGEANQLDDAASTVAAKASEFAARAGSTLRDAAGTVRYGAAQAGETVYDAGARAGQYMGRSVQQQPLLSLIGAVAIGYVVGFLLHSAASPLAPEPRSRRYHR
jgi:uncharacterized protein YjbJ (UPF0337 family)